jgi:hypothetical protein
MEQELNSSSISTKNAKDRKIPIDNVEHAFQVMNRLHEMNLHAIPNTREEFEDIKVAVVNGVWERVFPFLVEHLKSV